MWLLVAIVAQFVGGTSAVIDKLILKKSYPNPVGYTFWLGFLGVFSVIFLPFGFRMLNFSEFSIALLAGVFFILAMFFYFLALFYGEASDSIILIGAITPIFTYFFSSRILGIELGGYQLMGFSVLIFGGLILFFTEQKGFRFKITSYAILSAFSFGLSNTLTKNVFNFSNFATGFIWIKFAALLVVLSFLLFPALRKRIFHPKGKDVFKNKFGYFLNRGYAGLGSVLIFYALLLGLPPLVDSTYNLKFLFIFLGGWLILRERFKGWVLAGKIAAFIIISLGVIWLAVGEYYKSNAWSHVSWAPKQERSIVWGVTFSQKFSEMLGLDWKANYKAVLTELRPERIRLIAYWDFVEPEDDKFDFSDLDFQMDLAGQNNIGVILAIGQKLPRWPECHIPQWLRESAKSKPQIPNDKLLTYMQVVVERYKKHPALLYWQLENEPFLSFGECPKFDKELLDKEIALVKSLDISHPILITDSGEVGRWRSALKKGDIFGTTMYRRVYHDFFGFIDYHLPPEFFRIKEKTARWLTGERDKKIIVIELASEPWLPKQLYETSLSDQFEHFDLEFFKNTIEYAKATDFDEYYLWGAEWWYWLKVKKDMPEFWDFAKSIN